MEARHRASEVAAASMLQKMEKMRRSIHVLLVDHETNVHASFINMLEHFFLKGNPYFTQNNYDFFCSSIVNFNFSIINLKYLFCHSNNSEICLHWFSYAVKREGNIWSSVGKHSLPRYLWLQSSPGSGSNRSPCHL